jgi:hypothetical protein
MVDNESELPTKCKYGVCVLPLLSGREEIIEPGKVRYIRESERMKDMFVSLMSQTGKQIRVLRGHRLNSIYAPVAGIRYDKLCGLPQSSTIDENKC